MDANKKAIDTKIEETMRMVNRNEDCPQREAAVKCGFLKPGVFYCSDPDIAEKIECRHISEETVKAGEENKYKCNQNPAPEVFFRL